MSHKVTIHLGKFEVGKDDIHISIKKDSSKIGEILLSRGNLEWWPRGNKRRKKRLTWKEFQYLIEEYGRTVKN